MSEQQAAELLALMRQIAQDLAAIRRQQELASLLGVPMFRVE